MRRPTAELYVGLMSGTSLDGVDAALVRLTGRAEHPAEARLIAFRTVPYPSGLRERIASAARGRAGSDELAVLDFELAERFAQAVEELLEEAGVESRRIAAIGSHGQTVWHRPPEAGSSGATLQIGEAAVVAERTGIPVVADFRVRDVAAGGHGAPLTPYFDRLLLASPERSRGIQNIGGIANVTAVPPVGSDRAPVAFDTGPGVAVLDRAVDRLTAGAQRFDEGGAIAATGRVLESPLREWLADDFFDRRPPRSTGRERFGDERVDGWLAAHASENDGDLIATLTELIARSIVDSYRWIGWPLDEVVVCGGGARNPEIVRRLSLHLGETPVRLLDELGWSADAREAAAFALLARQHRLRIPVDLSWATGARGPRILGKEVPA